MSEKALKILNDTMMNNPEDAVVISLNDEGGIAISWTQMTMERLAYLESVFSHAVRSKIAQSLMGAVPPAAKPENPSTAHKAASKKSSSKSR